MIYTRFFNLVEALNDFPTFNSNISAKDEFFKYLQPVKIKKYREQASENQDAIYYIRQY